MVLAFAAAVAALALPAATISGGPGAATAARPDQLVPRAKAARFIGSLLGMAGLDGSARGARHIDSTQA